MNQWQLQELLHVANERCLQNIPTKEQASVGKERNRQKPLLRIMTEKGLPPWITQITKEAIFKKIRAMTAGDAPLIQWKEPLQVHAQMKLTLRDSQLNPNDARSLESVVFRAVPRFQGVCGLDCIKVLVESEGDESCIYFAQCMAFIQDAEDEYYVVVRWFETLENHYGFDNISHVPSFKLEQENRPDSYCILPASAILNGAVMIPGKDNRYWALLSPKEEKTYALQFHAQ